MDLDCVVAIKAGDQRLGPFRAPEHDELWIGREDGNGLHLSQPWISRQQARIIWTPAAWLLENGARSRMTVTNAWLEDVMVAPGGMVVLQPGDTRIRWPQLDDHLILTAKVGQGIGGELEASRNDRRIRPNAVGTQFVVQSFLLSEEDRKVLLAAFEHLLRRTPKPENVAAAIAPKLGVSVQAVKNRLGKVRERVNADRWQNLQDSEELGEYLVNTTHTLTPEDLEGLPR